MATGEIQLTTQAALIPVSSFPALKRHASSGTETPEGWILAFDAGSSEYVYFQFKVPADYASDPVLKIYYSMASATSGAVRWNCNVMCTTDDADDLDTAAAGSDNAVNDTVPNVAGELGIASITLTNNDSMAADDMCVIKVERDGANAGDTATGDAELWMVVLQYTTS